MKTMIEQKRVFDSNEAMEYIGVKKNKFFEILKEGKLKPLKGLGRNHKFDIKDLDAFIDDLKKS